MFATNLCVYVGKRWFDVTHKIKRRAVSSVRWEYTGWMQAQKHKGFPVRDSLVLRVHWTIYWRGGQPVRDQEPHFLLRYQRATSLHHTHGYTWTPTRLFLAHTHTFAQLDLYFALVWLLYW